MLWVGFKMFVSWSYPLCLRLWWCYYTFVSPGDF